MPFCLVGICALSPSSENCYLAALAQQHTGDILLFDALNLTPLTILQAHKSPIAQLAFNDAGTLLATASEKVLLRFIASFFADLTLCGFKGTIIRVFSIPDCQCRYQFRRGSFSAEISSLSFNSASTFLTVSSNSETVHIFKLAVLPSIAQAVDLDDGSRKGTGMANYMPAALTEMLEPLRDFAHLRLPEGKVFHIAALNNAIPQVMVATKTGYFYLYAIDLERGGECTLVKQFNLLSMSA